MVICRNQDGELGAMIGQWQVVLDLVLNGQRLKVPLKVRDWKKSETGMRKHARSNSNRDRNIA
jgi:hypothetical protein